MLETVDSLLPKCYNAIAFAGGAVGGAVAFAVGGIDVAVQWLFAFVVVDYLLGMAAACKTHVWSSSTGFKGIIKKAVIFSVVCVGNGLDQVLGSGGTLRNAAIAAYCVNELMCKVLCTSSGTKLVVPECSFHFFLMSP